MHIASFLPLSLSDDPGRVAAVVFLAGCNFCCPYCHNPELVLPNRVARAARIEPAAMLETLRMRAGFLDSVVVTGGEPTLQPDLTELLDAIKSVGLRVKLDTNGARPETLSDLLAHRLVDFVAMDLKAPRQRYREFAGVEVDVAAIERSVELIRTAAPDYAFRTTVAPGLGQEDLLQIGRWIERARRYVLQPFRVPTEKTLVDPSWRDREALSVDELRKIWRLLSRSVESGGVRG